MITLHAVHSLQNVGALTDADGAWVELEIRFINRALELLLRSEFEIKHTPMQINGIRTSRNFRITLPWNPLASAP